MILRYIYFRNDPALYIYIYIFFRQLIFFSFFLSFNRTQDFLERRKRRILSLCSSVDRGARQRGSRTRRTTCTHTHTARAILSLSAVPVASLPVREDARPQTTPTPSHRRCVSVGVGVKSDGSGASPPRERAATRREDASTRPDAAGRLGVGRGEQRRRKSALWLDGDRGEKEVGG